MKLYHGEPNAASLTVMAALFEKGIDAEFEAIDLCAGARHNLPINYGAEVVRSVEGEGPVLVNNGEAMADSVFIGCMLDESAGEASLVSGDAYRRWQIMVWCRQVIERVAPAASYLGNHAYLQASLKAMSDDDFAAMTDKIVAEDIRGRWQEARNGEYAEERLAECRGKIVQIVEKVESSLQGDWIFGDFSLADLETYSWLRGMLSLVPEAFAGHDAVTAWMSRVEARPSVAKALSMSVSGSPEKAWPIGPEINRWG